MTESSKRITASFWPRAAALVLDMLIVRAALVFVRLPALAAAANGESFLTRHVLFHHTGEAVLCYLLQSAYFVLMTYFGGATLGKRAMGLRVVSTDGQKCSFMTVLYRETIGRYLSRILFIGYLLAIGDIEHRTLHDRICDTRVVLKDAVRPEAVRYSAFGSGAADSWYRT